MEIVICADAVCAEGCGRKGCLGTQKEKARDLDEVETS